MSLRKTSILSFWRKEAVLVFYESRKAQDKKCEKMRFFDLKLLISPKGTIGTGLNKQKSPSGDLDPF